MGGVGVSLEVELKVRAKQNLGFWAKPEWVEKTKQKLKNKREPNLRFKPGTCEQAAHMTNHWAQSFLLTTILVVIIYRDIFENKKTSENRMSCPPLPS